MGETLSESKLGDHSRSMKFMMFEVNLDPTERRVRLRGTIVMGWYNKGESPIPCSTSAIMLYLVGLGLGDAQDITVKGLEVVKKADKVFLEAYTSILTVGKAALEEFYGRNVVLADREMVEQNSDAILEEAKDGTVAFLVVGDPLGATTHSDLILRAHQKGIGYRVIHNASIMNAIGSCGLQLYSFGETVSFVTWTPSWEPDSYVDKIEKNLEHGLHSLCLLDIKMKEQSVENLLKGNRVYEPPSFMTAAVAAQQILTVIGRRMAQDKPYKILSPSTQCVGLARLGSDTEKIVSCRLSEMADLSMGPPLHSLVVAGPMHPIENEMLDMFSIHGKQTCTDS